jgi:hypothetical protein
VICREICSHSGFTQAVLLITEQNHLAPCFDLQSHQHKQQSPLALSADRAPQNLSSVPKEAAFNGVRKPEFAARARSLIHLSRRAGVLIVSVRFAGTNCTLHAPCNLKIEF